MSFMFNPHPFSDPAAINTIPGEPDLIAKITRNTAGTCQTILSRIEDHLSVSAKILIGLDGYLTSPIDRLADQIVQLCAAKGIKVTRLQTSQLFQDSALLTKKLLAYLPEDRVTDPVLLYGSIYKEGYDGLLDQPAVRQMQKTIAAFRESGTGVLLVAGHAALIPQFQPLYDLRLYVDMTQKQTIINVRQGSWTNLGCQERLPVNLMLRRSYYIDFEAMTELRGNLIRENLIEFYLAGDDPEQVRMLPLDVLKHLFGVLVTYPLRCRPVYLEGIWGGFYFKHLRNLPESMKNCAWIFDLIPMEVSLAVNWQGLELEFPFYSFIQTMSEQLMGEKSVRKFGRFFPIRFNYDDTFHSSGNMSIQVHPDAKYVKNQNDELGRQDESYYIVATGHGAKTYIGLKDDADAEEFIARAKRAEELGEGFDHDQYIHSVQSFPGRQFMLPAGTIHSSGRNQVILEIGSLTIGSYTYKMYDYMRKDLEGKLRPIHTFHGDKVLRRDFRAKWVMKNLVQEPRIIRSGEGWKEVTVGQHDLLYFSLRNLTFDKRIEDDTRDRFHVLSLVDGEQVMVRSVEDPRRFFIQKFLDIVVVPAGFGPYEIINQSVGPVTIHKTLLKDGFEND